MRPTHALLLTVAPAVLALCLAAGSAGAWSTSPFINNPACQAPGAQHYVATVTDEAGGVYIAWQDARVSPSNPDIYLQHLDKTGAVATGWPTDGLGICTDLAVQLFPVICEDVGGVVAWQDERAGTYPETSTST